MAAPVSDDSSPRRRRARPVVASLVIAVLRAVCCAVIGVTRDVVRPWPGGMLYGALVGTRLLVQLTLCHLEWARQQRLPDCHHVDAVTVVIPTYNEPPSILRDCVRSALSQGQPMGHAVGDGPAHPPPTSEHCVPRRVHGLPSAAAHSARPPMRQARSGRPALPWAERRFPERWQSRAGQSASRRLPSAGRDPRRRPDLTGYTDGRPWLQNYNAAYLGFMETLGPPKPGEQRLPGLAALAEVLPQQEQGE